MYCTRFSGSKLSPSRPSPLQFGRADSVSAQTSWERPAARKGIVCVSGCVSVYVLFCQCYSRCWRRINHEPFGYRLPAYYAALDWIDPLSSSQRLLHLLPGATISSDYQSFDSIHPASQPWSANWLSLFIQRYSQNEQYGRLDKG